jgi:hypothetical protein
MQFQPKFSNKNPAALNAELGFLLGIALTVFSCILKLDGFGARNRGDQIGAGRLV